jgi:hypothetical protein
VSFGVNVDPDNPANAPTPEQVLRYNCRWVRLVSRYGVDDYAEAMQARGVMVLAVVTEQSGGYICAADMVQIGNECDLPDHGDSFSPNKYVEYWNLYYGTWFAPGKPFAHVPVISAGFASGQTSYWQHIVNLGGLRGCSGLSVHPYAKTAAQARSLLLEYQRLSPALPALPIFVTEWNRPTAEIPGFAAMLNQTAAMSCWFSWGGLADGSFKASEQQLRILGTT